MSATLSDNSKADNAKAHVTKTSPRRILLASLVGTAVEFYDFYIYATAVSLVFGALFFPASSPPAQLLASYATFSVAFVARPFGAIVFGHFGDRIGRKSTLVASLMMMGGSTTAVGFLPTYGAVGWYAPLLLCVLRFGQGFGLGGEWGGAALLAVENAPPGYRARYGMFPQLGAPVGFMASNAFFLVLGLFLTPAQFQEWGWRVPFLSSALLVAIGLWVRLKLTETPAFAAAMASAPPAHVPLLELIRKFPRQLIAATFAVIACFAIFYLTTVFALGYATTVLGYDRRAILSVLLCAIPFMAVGIVGAGYWSDKTNPRRVLMIGAAVSVAAGALLAPMMGSGSLVTIWMFLTLLMLIMGLVYGPLGTWLPDLFPARVRYTGASLTFTLGGILGGGVTPFVAQSLANVGGLTLVGLYLAATGLISFIGLAALKRPTAY